MIPDQYKYIPPEAVENKDLKLARALFEKGVPPFDIEGRIGLHGTSIENFVKMVKSGNIHSDGEKTAAQGETHNDRFYIVPHKAQMSEHPVGANMRELHPDTVFQAAADYAKITAFFSYVNERLPGLLNDSTYATYAMYPSDERGQESLQYLIERAVQLGFEEDFVKTVLDDARQRRGVVLAINIDVLNKYKIKQGDITPDREIYIEAENLPFADIVIGAEPMIAYDKPEIFSKLADS